MTEVARAQQPGPETLERSPSAAVRDRLACPVCRKPLVWEDDLVLCRACPRKFRVVDGVPVLLADAGQDDEHKLQQVRFFDEEVNPEFELTRPHGTPAFYGWLLAHKLERSVEALRPLLPGATAVNVCGGSGMDAEFLARAGARVIAVDLSLEAAMRVRQRAERYSLDITPIVADVEALPFRDGAAELVYVHDGLHHLEDPLRGIAEMARVSSRALSINEPARAGLTALAIRLGLAFEHEDAGNRIARLDPTAITRHLEQLGFRTLLAERYGMYYSHEPGAVFRFLSRRRPGRLARSAVSTFNAVAGGLGNKLTIQAVRA